MSESFDFLSLSHSPPPPPSAAGKPISEAEFTKMAEEMPLTALWNPTTSKQLPSFTDVMGFNGSPEIINGRLAMLAFVAAVGAELSSGEMPHAARIQT